MLKEAQTLAQSSSEEEGAGDVAPMRRSQSQVDLMDSFVKSDSSETLAVRATLGRLSALSVFL